MKTGRQFWAPDTTERAAEIQERRAKLEERYIASVRARITLLQNLRPEQHEILNRLIEDVLKQPRDDHELRAALERLHSYLTKRWNDPRNAPKPIPEKAKKKLEDALAKRGVEPTDEALYELWAKAQK